MPTLLKRATVIGAWTAAAAWLLTVLVRGVSGQGDSNPPVCTNVFGSVVSCDNGDGTWWRYAFGVAAVVFVLAVVAAAAAMVLVGRVRSSATTR
jgi:hypothetical protein